VPVMLICRLSSGYAIPVTGSASPVYSASREGFPRMSVRALCRNAVQRRFECTCGGRSVRLYPMTFFTCFEETLREGEGA